MRPPTSPELAGILTRCVCGSPTPDARALCPDCEAAAQAEPEG